MKIITSVLAATAALAVSAQAATVSFDNKGNFSASSTTLTATDGTEVFVQAGTAHVTTYNYFSGKGTADITVGGSSATLGFYNGAGMGISTSCGRFCSDSHQIDGRGVDEVAIFSFDEAVTLTSIVFNSNYVEWDDDFVFFVGNSVDTLEAFSFLNILGNTPTGAASVALNVVGSVFAIGAASTNDEFKLTDLVFDAIQTPPAPVPVPAALPLMLTGLAGLRFARRRKTA